MPGEMSMAVGSRSARWWGCCWSGQTPGGSGISCRRRSSARVAASCAFAPALLVLGKCGGAAGAHKAWRFERDLNPDSSAHGLHATPCNSLRLLRWALSIRKRALLLRLNSGKGLAQHIILRGGLEACGTLAQLIRIHVCGSAMHQTRHAPDGTLRAHCLNRL